MKEIVFFKFQLSSKQKKLRVRIHSFFPGSGLIYYVVLYKCTQVMYLLTLLYSQQVSGMTISKHVSPTVETYSRLRQISYQSSYTWISSGFSLCLPSCSGYEILFVHDIGTKSHLIQLYPIVEKLLDNGHQVLHIFLLGRQIS